MKIHHPQQMNSNSCISYIRSIVPTSPSKGRVTTTRTAYWSGNKKSFFCVRGQVRIFFRAANEGTVPFQRIKMKFAYSIPPAENGE